MAKTLLSREIATYDRLREQFEAEHPGEWVVIHGEDIAGYYESFDAAAKAAVGRFGSGPYLIREIGAPPLRVRVSALHVPATAEMLQGA